MDFKPEFKDVYRTLTPRSSLKNTGGQNAVSPTTLRQTVQKLVLNLLRGREGGRG